MKRVFSAVGVLLGVFVALSIITATPLVGEVVTLHTIGEDGEWQTTPLWVVDLGGASYLRAGTPEGSGWVTRLRANPQVRLERGEELDDVQLVEDPAKLPAVHREMAQKYGWADDFVALLSGDRSKSLALRIEAARAGP